MASILESIQGRLMEKISRVKRFCKDLDKSDPLPGLRNVDLKGILVKKYLPGRDWNQGSFAQQSSALPTELQEPC